MLDFFRKVASSIPADVSPPASQDGEVPLEPLMGATREDSSKRAGIIVLREDLDFYVIPPRANMQQPEMIEVKRAAARALLRQDGIFSGLKRSDEPGTTEAHLIEMLTAGYASMLETSTQILLIFFSAVSITRINGATVPVSLVRLSSAVLRLQGCAAISGVTI